MKTFRAQIVVIVKGSIHTIIVMTEERIFGNGFTISRRTLNIRRYIVL
ncbi:MAG: hypothetical protein SFT92_08810 [Rickettsiales bacterium]|nr:hypothetical protein [Rickettsiales bacterium]